MNKIQTIKLRKIHPARFPFRRPRVYTSLASKPRASVGSSFEEIAHLNRKGEFIGKQQIKNINGDFTMKEFGKEPWFRSTTLGRTNGNFSLLLLFEKTI